jgi:endonuclease/exonuclease/phosphatase family metal-dependent hydrolase
MQINIIAAFVLAGVAAITMAACAPQPVMPVAKTAEDTLRVGTYNVHYIILHKKTGAWSVGDWDRRKAPLDVAFQEMESFGGRSGSETNLALDWLLAQNPDFAAAAVGDPAVFPSTQPILYRTSRLKLLSQSWFFFSDTPDAIYSRTFNGSYPAFASLAQFKDRTTGKTFHAVNVHFEFKSRSNQLKSAALVAERIGPLIAAGEKVVLLGDLNVRDGAAPQITLSDMGLTFLDVKGSTYHLNRGLNLFGAIDHIGLSDGVSPAGEPIILRQKFEGEWPTDHYPVIADIHL